MNYKLYIGKVSGIKIFIHWTFVLLIAWIVYNDVKAGLGINDILWSVGFVFTIFGCVTLHELGHSLTAQRYHIKTRDITLLPIGGVASLESIPEKPKEELFVALAGPLVNIVIALMLLPFVTWPAVLEGLSQVGGSNFLLSLLSVNVTLAVFNMIPAFPMDGGRVLRALLSYKMDRVKATRIAASIGQVLALGFVVLGFYGNPFLSFIGIFIFLGAQAETKQIKSRALISGVTLRDVLMREVPLLDSKLTIRDAAQQLLAGQNKTFVVMNEGKPVGTLSHLEIVKALGEQGENASIASAMDKDLLYLNADLSLESALKELQRSKKPLALVSSQNALIGVVDIQNVTEFLLIRSAKQK
ncbi:MAG: site-2 protease family protein [Cyclobacteriaceae bacterium]|jgi:Zn-dependent protease/CBS domain-containing protein|nr:site-2 protease family protein [Cyclobacteriaceae bacterium]